MIVLWILFVGSVIVLPGTAILAFGWALRQGEFEHLEKTALSIFDEDEPVGVMTDRFPDTDIPSELPDPPLISPP
jgi:cbb3-type cytochrome oxidase maturation protein